MMEETEFIAKWNDNHFNNDVLMKAVLKGWINVVKILIQKGINIDEVNGYGATAFIEAIRNERYEIVDLLIDNGADVTWCNCRATFLSYWCCKHDLTKRLIEMAGPDNIDAVDYDGETLLANASTRGDLEMVKYCINRGANIHKRSNYGRTVIEMTYMNEWGEYGSKWVERESVIKFLFGQQIKTVTAIFQQLPQYIILWITDWLEGSDYLTEYEKIEIIERMQHSIKKLKSKSYSTEYDLSGKKQ